MGGAQGSSKDGAAAPFCCTNAPCCTKGGAGDSGSQAPKPMNYANPHGSDGELMPDPMAGGTHIPEGGAKTASADGFEAHLNEGEETYEDGSNYQGQLLDGRRHGRGTWTSPTEKYTGQWKHDHRDGHGTQVWQDERAHRTYEGQFKAGNFDGYGRMEWHTPKGLMVYEGQYTEDLKHGDGRYTWPDGRVYHGEWRRGLRSGKANFTNSAGERREGIWKDDRLERWLDDGPGETQAQ